MALDANGEGWALEVVRGKDAGRVFALGAGEVVLGGAPGGAGGIDLGGQEPASSTRKMAARHASIRPTPEGPTICDLESPEGTFVNRRRVLPGRPTPLRAGDVIQLGAVQLRLIPGPDQASTRRPDPAPIPPSTGPFSYALAGGTTCRTWDDFLTASSQRWDLIRGELTSGRLGAFLGSIGRADLAPPPASAGTADERLDAWLGALPTTRPAVPELDVHPPRLVIRATPGGGVVRKSVHVANVGHRLLRWTARVDPPGLAWLAIAPEFAGGPFATPEGADLAIEVAIPGAIPRPLAAELVIEANGGSKRVAVILEAKPAVQGEPEPEGPAPASGATLAELIGRQAPAARVATWAMTAVALRLVVGVAGGAIGEDAMTASGPGSPGLGGVALVLAAAGATAAAGLASRRGGRAEAPAGAIAGGCAGAIAASAVVAACRAIEPALGPWSTSILAVCALWSLLGAGLAGLSTLVAKGKP